MNRRVFTRRLKLLSLAATICVGAACICGTAHAALTWYDGFAISDVDDGAGPNYLAGNLAGQQGGSDAGAPGGIGFFDDAAGNPNPWLGVNNTDPADTDTILSAGSLTRHGQNLPSTGDKASDQPATGCCNTSRQSRDFNAPLQTMNGTIYMGFLVNFGLGNPGDPHYRAVEFWDGKNTDPGNGLGRVGDGVLNMSLGISSFGNYNNAVNQAADPNPNTQVSVRIDGVREPFGSVVQTNHQLEEHLEWFDSQQYGQTHSVVIKFDLTTNDIETGGTGDTVSFFLDPKPTDLVEPTPSLVVPGIDLRLDSMSSIILFHFTQTKPQNPGAFDELRVGTTWGEVAILGVPEPASLSLVGLAALGLVLSARRKRA